MQVRSRITGKKLVARLEMRRVAGQGPRFILFVQQSNGEQQALTRVAAVVGFELVEWSAEELTALTLAGFLLPRAGGKGNYLWRLAGILRSTRKLESRKRARAHHPMPANSKAKHAAGYSTDGEKTARRLQHAKDSPIAQLRTSATKLRVKEITQPV
jgi:hypothetical protein